MKITTGISEDIQELMEYSKSYTGVYGITPPNNFRLLQEIQPYQWAQVLEAAMRAKLQEHTIGFSRNPWEAATHEILKALGNNPANQEMASEFAHEIIYRIVGGWAQRVITMIQPGDVWTLTPRGNYNYDIQFVCNRAVVEQAIARSGGSWDRFVAEFY
jgi:hypothetical protein